MKRKIAFILPSLRGGGAERVVLNIIRNIDYSKFDINLILLKKEGPYIELLPENIEVFDLKSTRARNSILRLIKVINKIKPDVIFSTMGHINLVILALSPLFKGSPKIIVREANTPSKDLGKNKLLLSTLYRFLYPKAEVIIAQCKEMKKDIVGYFGLDENRIIYIYNPLDVPMIKGLAQGENPYQKNRINLLSVGRLTSQKGFDVLMNAFKIVVQEIPNVHLTILGDGQEKDSLQDQAVSLGIEKKVTFEGFKNNPYPYYKFADLYILSSRWEGFPNSLLEALACGTKVVSTNCKSGPTEIIGENDFGTLVEVENSEALAKGIIKSISEQNKTGNRAEFFDTNKIIKEYEEVLLR